MTDGGNDPAQGLFAAAVARHAAGDTVAAETLYRKVLGLVPEGAAAAYNLALLLRDTDRPGDAAGWLAWTVAAAPDHARAWGALAGVRATLGEREAAVDAARRALALAPDNAALHNAVGTILNDAAHPEEAEAALRRAVGLDPRMAAAWSNLGRLLARQERAEEAVAAHDTAVALDPDDARLHANRADALQRTGRLTDAAAACRRALTLAPDHPEALGNLGNALAPQGRVREAAAAYDRAVAAAPGAADLASGRLFLRQYTETANTTARLAAHAAWGVRFAPAVHAPPAREARPDRPLRVGYVSPDLREHSVAHFISGPLARHDPRVVEARAYAAVSRPDAVTAHLRGLCAGWRNVAGWSPEAVAGQARADGVDVLVDLAGHTAGNLLPVFGHRPAPVQVTWIGYPDTTGVAAMDYRLTDAVTDPPGITDPFHTETLVRLSGCFLAYTPPEPAPEPACDGPAAGPVFGSFNKRQKLTPAVLDLWAAVLCAVPGSRLMLKDRAFDQPEVVEGVAARLEKGGVSRERLVFHGHTPGRTAHLAAYNHIDVALDPFPYNGTTTTCEALWMGVPVVGLTGSRHAARVTTSLLRAAGLPELAAVDKAACVATAAAVAGRARRTTAARRALRARLARSPLLDAAAFTRRLEAAYQAMWRRWCAGQGR